MSMPGIDISGLELLPMTTVLHERNSFSMLAHTNYMYMTCQINKNATFIIIDRHEMSYGKLNEIHVLKLKADNPNFC